MRYYHICVKGSSIKSKELSMLVDDEDIAFDRDDSFFSTDRFSPKEPIPVEVFYYNGAFETVERDLVSAGNPQIVSEDFRKLVEELDPGAAQFFEIECRVDRKTFLKVNPKSEHHLYDAVNASFSTKKKYYVMHVTKSVLCLDKSRSIILKSLSYHEPGELNIFSAAVDASKIGENDHVFRLGEDTPLHFVSETFYKEWKKRKLTGVAFELRSE